MSDVSKKVREVYDSSASVYASKHPQMRDELRATAQAFLERVRPDARVLDLGCGAGRDMAWLEEHGFEVVGADLSWGMLSEARSLVQGPLLQVDMRQIPFHDSSFDAVWCMASMIHLPKSDAPLALAEMKRVLKPGSVMLLGLQAGEGEEWEQNTYGEGERFFARYSADEATTLLTKSGITVAACYVYELSYRTWLHLLATS